MSEVEEKKDLPAVAGGLPVIPEGHDRQRFIGSSEVAAIMNLAPPISWHRATPVEIWSHKINEGPVPPMEASLARFLGRRKAWEPIVEQVIKDEYDAKIVGRNIRYKDPDVPFFAAEIDLEAEVDGEIVNVEVKTVRPEIIRLARKDPRYSWGESGTSDIPLHYLIQTQFALGVTRRRRTLVAAFPGLDEELRVFPLERDDAGIEQLRAECVRFWNEHVLPKVPPPAQTSLDIAILFPGSVEKAVAASFDVEQAALRLRALLVRADADSAESDLLEFLVKREMGDAEKLLVSGKPIFSWKTKKAAGRFDVEGLKAAHPAIYKQFFHKGGTLRAFRRMAWSSSSATQGEDA